MRSSFPKQMKSIVILDFLLLLEISITQNIEKLIKPRCDGRTIKYSIFANFKEYLENEKNIDGNEIFYNLEVFKYKKLGTLSGTYYNKTILQSVEEYDNFDQILDDLRTLKIDGVIQPDRYAEDVKFFSNDLSLFPEPIQVNKIGFGIQKNNVTLRNQINEFIKNNREKHKERISLWTQLNFDEKHIDSDLKGKNGSLNVSVRFGNYPYAYKENNEIMGSEIDFLYLFAKEYGYKINLKEADTYEDQVESLKNKLTDIALGYFIIKDDKINEINYSEFPHESNVYIIVRYYNLPESIEFKNPHDSFEQFNGDNIGLISGSYYTSLTKSYFPKSEILPYPTFSEIYYHLLMKDIDGFLIDDIIAKYYKIVFNHKLSYYQLDTEPDNIGFAFQKNADGEALLNEFNDFLSTLNLENLYNKWYVMDTSKISFDKNLDSKDKLINVALNLELKPICFIEANEMKGLETEIIYRFAKAKNYNIKITNVNSIERLTYIEDRKADISGGILSITEERKKKLISQILYIKQVYL